MASLDKRPRHARLPSIDAFRFIAAFAVICIHTVPLGSAEFNLSQQAIGRHLVSLCRFAVSFFFVAAGYFFSRNASISARPDLIGWEYFRRLGVLFLAWSIIYIFYDIPINAIRQFDNPIKMAWRRLSWFVAQLTENPIAYCLSGTAGHLWFIPALMFSIVIAGYAMNASRKIFIVVVVLSLILYTYGVFCRSYEPFGSVLPKEAQRLFFPLFLTLLGVIVQQRPSPALWVSCVVFMLGMLLHFGEVTLLPTYLGHTVSNDFVLATPAFGLGVFLIALSCPGCASGTPLPAWGRYTLGIYLLHLLVIRLTHGLRFEGTNLVWEFVYPVLILGITSLLVIGMDRVATSRKLIT